MAYDQSLDKILAEEESVDGNITARVMSYNGGEPKICFVSSKNDFPIKRIPVNAWEAVVELTNNLISKLEQEPEEENETEGKNDE